MPRAAEFQRISVSALTSTNTDTRSGKNAEYRRNVVGLTSWISGIASSRTRVDVSSHSEPDLMQERSLKPITDFPLEKAGDSILYTAVANEDAPAFQTAILNSWSEARTFLNGVIGEGVDAADWSSSGDSLTGNSAECLDTVTSGSPRDRTATSKNCMQLATHLLSDLRAGVAATNVILLSLETLVRYGELLSAATFHEMYTLLANVGDNIIEHAEQTLDCPDERTASDIVANGEIPLALSIILRPFTISKTLFQWGMYYLTESLEAATDTDGTPHASVARSIESWLAPFVRSSIWANAFGTPWNDQATQHRLKLVIHQAGLLLTPSGFLTQTQQHDLTFPESLLSSIQRIPELSRGAETNSILADTLNCSRGLLETSAASRSEASMAHCSGQSDWAQTAVFRNSSHANSDLITLAWDRSEVSLNLAATGVPILWGNWRHEIEINGTRCKLDDEWECTCWFEDEEVAFAELERQSASGIRQNRHVLLNLRDQFAVITDTVVADDRGASINLENSIEVGPGVTSIADDITRELVLHKGNLSVRMIPLWLDDDRIQNAAGRFECVNDCVSMKVEGEGSVMMPVVLDWNPNRLHHPADWNRLTITEDREIQSPWCASAHRVRIGPLQLLLYRSLQRGETLRCVLGHHTSNETIYGRVNNKGEVTPVVVVES